MASPLIFQQAKALLFESGASRRLGELVKGLGSKRTLLVTDPGVRGAGLLEEGVESLIDPACERGQQEVGLRVDAPQLLLSRLVAEQAEQQVIHGTPYNAVPNE